MPLFVASTQQLKLQKYMIACLYHTQKTQINSTILQTLGTISQKHSNYFRISEKWSTEELKKSKKIASQRLKFFTSNHMFKSTICDKLPARIFENFEIAQVKQWQFENFQKS